MSRKKPNLINQAFNDSPGGWRIANRDNQLLRKTKWQGPRPTRSYKLKQSFKNESGSFSVTGGAMSAFANKKFVLGVVLIAMVLGGIVIYQGSAFHSYSTQCTRSPTVAAPCEDPQTIIWTRNVGAPASLADFSLSPGQRQAYQTSCDGVGGDACVELDAFSGNNSIAVTQNTVGELGIANGKTLGLSFGYVMANSGFGTGLNWGVFLTTNKTAAAHDIGSSAQYNPLNDPSVVFTLQMSCSGGTCGGTGTLGTYSTAIYINKEPGSGRTLAQEDTGTCGGTSSSCIGFLSNTSPSGCLANPCTGSNVVNTMGFYANYTGSTLPGGSCSVIAGIFAGSGCSWLYNFVSAHNPIVSADATGIDSIPVNSWLHGNYYLGFFSTLPGYIIRFELFPGFIAPSGYTIGSSIIYYVPSPTSTTLGPQIDTSGYFGPIIKALISIGVFILNAIMSFVGFLLPAITTALNVIGGFFGMAGLGTQIVNFFLTVADFFSKIFGTVFSTSAAAVTFLAAGITLVTTVTTAFFNNAGSALAALANIFTFLIPIGNLILLGTHFSIAVFVTLDLFVGMFSAFQSFDSWLGWFRAQEMLFLKIFKFLAYIAEESVKLLARLRTVAPRPAGV